MPNYALPYFRPLAYAIFLLTNRDSETNECPGLFNLCIFSYLTILPIYFLATPAVGRQLYRHAQAGSGRFLSVCQMRLGL